MSRFRTAIAAAVLIFPHAAFSVASEAIPAPEASVVQQGSPDQDTDQVIAQQQVSDARQPAAEFDALARASAMPAKPKAVRPARLSAVRAVSAHPEYSCSGYWCGRQFVLIVGIGF